MSFDGSQPQHPLYSEMSSMRPYTPQPPSSYRLNSNNPTLLHPSPRLFPPDLQVLAQQDCSPAPSFQNYPSHPTAFMSQDPQQSIASNFSFPQLPENAHSLHQPPMPQERWPYYENRMLDSQGHYPMYSAPSQQAPTPPSPTAATSAPAATVAGSLDPATGIFYRTPQHPRLRTAQACEKCRTRKAKCSGDHPACRRCVSRGLVCEYAAEGRIRGPNKPKSKDGTPLDGKPLRPSARKASLAAGGSKSTSTTAKAPSHAQAKSDKATPSPLSSPDSVQRPAPRSLAQRRMDKPRPPPLRLDLAPAMSGPQSGGSLDFSMDNSMQGLGSQLSPSKLRVRTLSAAPIRHSVPSYPDLSPSHGIIHRSSVHGMSEISTIMAMPTPPGGDAGSFSGFEFGGQSSGIEHGGWKVPHGLLGEYLPRQRMDSHTSDVSLDSSVALSFNFGSGPTSPLPFYNHEHSASGCSSSPSPVLTPGARDEQVMDILYHQDALLPTAMGDIDDRSWDTHQNLENFDGQFGNLPKIIWENIATLNPHPPENEEQHPSIQLE